MNIAKLLKVGKPYILIVLVAAVGLYVYFDIFKATDTTDTAAFYVVKTVERGEVSSGIETTGKIVVAQKLDLDVYKQTEQIAKVNVVNGQHVEAGDVLISFDKNDAFVDTQSAQVSVVEAELTLKEESTNASDPNTEIRSKENQITGFEKAIADANQDIQDVFRDFLNKDLEVLVHSDRSSFLEGRAEPILSGRYVSDIEGQYVIEVYASAADSGYSYRVSGLESMTGSVIFW